MQATGKNARLVNPRRYSRTDRLSDIEARMEAEKYRGLMLSYAEIFFLNSQMRTFFLKQKPIR